MNNMYNTHTGCLSTNKEYRSIPRQPFGKYNIPLVGM